MRLRVASYNVHKCLGTDGRRLPERTLDVIAALSADIVALQEVDLRLGSRPAALPHGRIEAATGLRPVMVGNGGVSLGWHGQTLLLRPGFEAERTERFELPALEPRGAVAAVIAGPAGRFRVVAVHLGLLRRWRRLQLAAIRARLAEREPLPTLILGDFNEWSSALGTEPLREGFRVHAPGRSFPALQPMGRLDRLALSPGLHLVDAGVHDTALARAASDHLPVWADIRAGLSPDAAPG